MNVCYNNSVRVFDLVCMQVREHFWDCVCILLPRELVSLVFPLGAMYDKQPGPLSAVATLGILRYFEPACLEKNRSLAVFKQIWRTIFFFKK